MSELSITAKFIGPVLSLDGKLSKRKENLIFAPNGTGKTFLARALRCLDLYCQNKDIGQAASDIVSEEASQGEFSISCGEEKDSLTLTRGNAPSVTLSNHIFHVFSEDFIHEELRERRYIINGEIKGSIALDIGSDINKIKDAETAYKEAQQSEQTIFENLQTGFEKNKETELRAKTNLNRSLGAYINLSLDTALAKYHKKSFDELKSFTQIIEELNTLKSIPDAPAYPNLIQDFSIHIDWDSLKDSLKRITSPSSVADDIKAKVGKHTEFYRTGLEIHNEHSEICPFCEQNIASDDAKNLIECYIKYFADAEEKHKNELRSFYKKIKDIETKTIQNNVLRTKGDYDELKQYIPSQKEKHFIGLTSEFNKITEILSEILRIVEDKGKDLTINSSLNNKDMELKKAIDTLNENIKKNNKEIETLKVIVADSTTERKKLREQACFAFEKEFCEKHETDIKIFNESRIAKAAKKEEWDKAGKDAPKQDTKKRVADTFSKILNHFFGDKYTFDRVNFILKRGDSEMQRGNDKTLSEGEKSVIAFCYFIASTHCKVETQGDYKNLFLVFDDPVTSLSYDYVYRVAELLRNIHISNEGEIQWQSTRKSFNNTEPEGNPKLLILTHSTYFFNLLSVNGIVGAECLFHLNQAANEHKIETLIKYIVPFSHQLEHIYKVSKALEKPQYHTGVSVRATLEATVRICYPKKCNNDADIFNFLTKDKGYSFSSLTLVNMAAHGNYFNESAPPDDIILACKEAVKIVNDLLPGQIELLDDKKT